MYKKIKNLSIANKIIIIVLIASFISQIGVGIIAFNSMSSLSNYTKEMASKFGGYVSDDSENALKKQAEMYLSKLAVSASNTSDDVFERVRDEVSSMAISMENIYVSNAASGGSIPPLPEMTQSLDNDNSRDAVEKAYIVDLNNVSEDKTGVLVYNSEYYNNSDKDVYVTNIKDWMALSEEQREEIQSSKIVVSNNTIPSNQREELSKIRNFKQFVKPLYETDTAISEAYVGTESGILYKYSAASSNVRYVPENRSWYIDAVAAKMKGDETPVWQSTYVSASTGELGLTCSKAYTDSNGNILGVVAADMYLSDINDFTINYKVGDTGHAFIIDDTGKILMHPGYSENSNFNANPLDTDIDETYKNTLLDMSYGHSGVSVNNIGDKEYYIAYAPMVTTGWSFGIITELDEIVQPIKETRLLIEEETKNTQNLVGQQFQSSIFKFIIVYLICALISIAIGILLAKALVKPIKKLMSGVKRISYGDLSVKLDVESEDEVGKLSQAFNKMTANLKRYVENLAKTTAEKERIHGELNVAKKIQSSMLPCIFPAFPGRKDFDIYAIMDPAKEVGGDFYDFFFIGKEHLALVISDVSGKGVSAALFMVIAKILIKNQAQPGVTPAEILESVNNQLCENNDAGMFVTSFLGICNIKTGKFVYSNAGHNPPLIYRKKEDKFEWLKGKHGFVLAGMKNMKYKNEELYLKPEDMIYMYTDGVTEATNKNNELYSEKRLYDIISNPEVKKMSVEDMVKCIRKSIDEFANGAERADDITMLAFRNFTIESDEESEK